MLRTAKKLARFIMIISRISCLVLNLLKGPKHDQVEGEFFLQKADPHG
jgi:hypothetical protein